VECWKAYTGEDISTDRIEKECYENWWRKTREWLCLLKDKNGDRRLVKEKDKPFVDCFYFLEQSLYGVERNLLRRR